MGKVTQTKLQKVATAAKCTSTSYKMPSTLPAVISHEKIEKSIKKTEA